MDRLPDTEFDVMSAVWSTSEPITAAAVMAHLEPKRAWRVQTVITLMNRLVERGFLATEKRNRERLYHPLVARDAYLQFESERFLKRYHGNSLVSLVSALSGEQSMTAEAIAQLEAWIDLQKE